MATLQSKRFDEPDELVTLPLLVSQVVVLGEVYVARSTHEPGWRWSEHVKPVVGTPSCLHHHKGVVVAGQMEVETDTGARRRIGAGEIERDADNIRGVAVHAVTRIAALAEPGEVLVSAPTASLLEGSDLGLVDAGEHRLKGLPGRRRLHRLAG